MSKPYKLIACAIAASMLAAATPAKRAPAPAALLQASLADPGRAAQRGADARRHPFQLVALAELKAGQRILDLIPGDGYWTRIFSTIVGPRGRVYAVWPRAYARLALANVRELQALSASKEYANVVTRVEPTAELTAPEPLDVVWTSQNFHDYNDPFMGRPGPAVLARSAYRLLRPGGLFIVIDHDAAPGRGMRDTDSLHRIERSTVIALATGAGFRLVGESRVLRNPADPLTIRVFDRSVRGRTSQFALEFRKPPAR